MFNIFNSQVFFEIGEVIGNVDEVVRPRRSYADDIDQAFRRRLSEAEPLIIPILAAEPREPAEVVIVIDIPYQKPILMDEEEAQ